MTFKRHKIVFLAAVFACMLPTTAVFAELEEIVVTAERRESSVQDIPIAVSAFSQTQLDRMQITETLDLIRAVPNMVGSNNTGLGTANTYSIRGLNNTESIATFDPPVGSYVDDIFIQRQNANNFALFDIERVEVLRGPQGTLFGRNTTGGAVRVILKNPADEFGGFVEAGAGQYDEVNFRASIDMPLNEGLRTKLSAYYVSDDGYVDQTQPNHDDLNYEDSWGARLGLAADFNECSRWYGSIAYNDNEHANVYNASVGGDRVSNSGLADGAFAGSGGGLPILAGSKANLPGNYNRTESTLFTSNLEFDTTFGTLNFITGYVTLDQEFSLDFFNTPSPVGGFTIANIGEHDQFSQEVKLSGTAWDGKLDYVTGVYYFDEDNETDFGDVFFIGFPLVLADRVLKNDAESVAVYAQGDFHLDDQWTLTLGLRYTDEDKDVEFDDNRAGGTLNNADIQALGIPTSQSTDKLTPRFAINYEMNDNLSLYGSVTRGFKSGGWNARGTSPGNLTPFGPETATNYEIGMKSEWADNTVRVNVAAFVNDIEDFQLPSAYRNPTNGSITFITQNFADLEITGFETELTWQPTDALNIFANIGIQDSKYQELNPAITAQQNNCQTNGLQCGQGIVNPTGGIATPVRAPETSITVGASYVIDFDNGMSLTPSFMFSDIGDHAIGTSNVLGDEISYDHLNLGVTLAGPDNRWSVALSCTNCSDEEQEVSNLAGFIYLNEPERWNLRARLNF